MNPFSFLILNYHISQWDLSGPVNISKVEVSCCYYDRVMIRGFEDKIKGIWKLFQNILWRVVTRSLVESFTVTDLNWWPEDFAIFSKVRHFLENDFGLNPPPPSPSPLRTRNRWAGRLNRLALRSQALIHSRGWYQVCESEDELEIQRNEMDP